MTKKQLFKAMKQIADYTKETNNLYSAIYDEFDLEFEPFSSELLEECTAVDNNLYSSDGKRLATGGLVDGQYYCYQKQGYLEDDYHGFMYFPVGVGKYVRVHFEC